jgi:hypothetical protein
MTYYPISKWKILRFEPSNTKGKKYDAILTMKSPGNTARVPFGSSYYEQYKDTTGLRKYSRFDHLNKKRQTSYIARHKGFIKDGFYSPGYFSMRYLWT